MASIGRSVCDRCKININLRRDKFVTCEGDCKRWWHYPKCINLTSEKYDSICNSDEIWFCDQCKKKKKQQRKSLMADQTTTLCNADTPTGTPTYTATTDQVTLEKIYSELKFLNQAQGNMCNQLGELKKTIDDYKMIVDNLIEENTELKNQNEILTSKIENIEYIMDEDKQKQLQNNLVITGISEVENENLKQIVMEIGKVLEVNIQEEDIQHVERKFTTSKNSGFPKSIIIQFKKENLKNEILTQNKTKRINTRSLNNTCEKRNIYIQQQLTKRRQYLYKLARDLKRENLIKYAWVKDGEIYIRKTDSSKIIRIKQKYQIDNFKKE